MVYRGMMYNNQQVKDIIYVLDNRIGIVDEIKQDDLTVKQFLKDELLKIISNARSNLVILNL